MAQITKYETIDEVTRQICKLRNDPDAHSYVLVASTLSRVLYQINLHLTPPIKTVELTIGSNLKAILPNDFVLDTKVGVPSATGRLRILLEMII